MSPVQPLWCQVLSSVLTADLSPSRCLVLGMLLTASCNVLASLLPASNAAELVVMLAGLLGWAAYIGAASVGLPMGWLIETYGWQAWPRRRGPVSGITAGLVAKS
eukprot:Skav209454  [mRNA]  locus=scaffold4004:10759:19236:- [translate_table: standard]